MKIFVIEIIKRTSLIDSDLWASNNQFAFQQLLITFVPGTKGMALAFVAPGGILTMVWMILFTLKLFQLSK